MTDEPTPPTIFPFPARRRYQAFRDTGLAVPQVELRTAGGLVSVLPYCLIGVFVFRFLAQDELSFGCPSDPVKIRGRNLRAIADTMGRRVCAFVQEFDAREFLPPSPDAAFVEYIEAASLPITPGRDGDEEGASPDITG